MINDRRSRHDKKSLSVDKVKDYIGLSLGSSYKLALVIIDSGESTANKTLVASRVIGVKR